MVAGVGGDALLSHGAMSVNNFYFTISPTI